MPPLTGAQRVARHKAKRTKKDRDRYRVQGTLQRRNHREKERLADASAGVAGAGAASSPSGVAAGAAVAGAAPADAPATPLAGAAPFAGSAASASVAIAAVAVNADAASFVTATISPAPLAGFKGTRPLCCTVKYKKGELVFPPPEPSIKVLQVLSGLSTYMQTHWKEVKVEIENLCKVESSVGGVRPISGGRYELFVNADGKGCGAFSHILNLSEQVRTKAEANLSPGHLGKLIDDIVHFATQQAKTITELSSGYVMQNFGYIVSHGSVKKQDIHIDLENKQHYQLGLLCSKNTHMTSEYEPTGQEMELGAKLSVVWKNMPPNLADKLSEIPNVQKLLDGYGPLLSTPLKKINIDSKKNGKLPIGTLLCLPGRVPHCGPEVETGFRAVLFFTATPVGMEEYDVDKQYCRTTLVSDILSHSWTSLNKEEREYMLMQWYNVGLSQDARDVVYRVNHEHLTLMAEAIWKARKKREALIKALAEDPIWDEKEGASNWKNRNYNFTIPAVK